MRIQQKIRTFYQISFRRKYLVLVTFMLSLYSNLLFRFFRKNAIFGKRHEAPLPDFTDMALVRDISFAIRIVKRYAPWTNVCRHEAYQAKVLCRFYNIPYQIFIGFRKDTNGQIEGHAWTTVNQEIITGFCRPEDFVVQYIYS